MSSKRFVRFVLALAAVAAATVLGLARADGDDQAAGASARRTELVELIERCSPSVVDINTYAPIPNYPGSYTLSWGSGSILHESGFVVTNDHIARYRGQQNIILNTGESYEYRVIALSPNEDLAILKADPSGPLAPIRLGRSNDLMLGEPVLVIGNPGGLTHTVSTGIVSRLEAGGGGYLPGGIQINAAINGGNSGGPVINALGEQIGVVVAKSLDTEGLGFAIQIDRLRGVLPDMLSAETRYGYRLGLTVDVFGPTELAAAEGQAGGVVTAVEADSPAAAAGIEFGDIITQFGEMAIRDGMHFYLALIEREGGQEIPIRLVRDGQAVEVVVTLGDIPPRPAEQVEGLTQGILLEAYLGQWDQLPDFDELEPTSAGSVPQFALHVGGGRTEDFALRFTGYIEAPADGLYTFYTNSDDGSRLYIGGDPVVNNDGLHAPVEASGIVRLAAGKHPIIVTFFQRAGGAALEVSYEGPGVDRQIVPAEALFHHEPAPADDGPPVPADIEGRPARGGHGGDEAE